MINIFMDLNIRTVCNFSYETFDQHVAKWAREEHVTTDQNWMHQQVISNRLERKILF